MHDSFGLIRTQGKGRVVSVASMAASGSLFKESELQLDFKLRSWLIPVGMKVKSRVSIRLRLGD